MKVVLGIVVLAALILVAGVTGAYAVCGVADWLYSEFIREDDQ